jgi:hypothetical protein
MRRQSASHCDCAAVANCEISDLYSGGFTAMHLAELLATGRPDPE